MGFLSGVFGAVTRGVGGFLAGGPAGAVAGIAAPLVTRRRPVVGPDGSQLRQGFQAGADSVFVTRRRIPGVFESESARIYGPRIGPPRGQEGVPQVPGGGQAVMTVPSCPMPVGRGQVRIMPSPCAGYHWNRGRYYVFGDCRTGGQAGVVDQATRLVRNRRLNPANAQAAMRAARRLNGAASLLRRIERITGRLVGRAARRTPGSRAACKCK